MTCTCVSDATQCLLVPKGAHITLFSCPVESASPQSHACTVWDCCFYGIERQFSCNGGTHWIPGCAFPTDEHARRERLAEIMLGIIPPCLGGDVRDWEKGDESITMVHNMVSTSVVHGTEMPINLSQLAMLLPCSTYDRKRFAAITIRIDHPRCTALLFTSGKLVITGVKSWCVFFKCLKNS